MLKGGYKIIDLKEVNLTVDQTVTVDGIYESIESSYRKPLLFSGINVANVEKNDTFVNVITNGELYEITMYGIKLVINSNDEIAITSVA